MKQFILYYYLFILIGLCSCSDYPKNLKETPSLIGHYLTIKDNNIILENEDSTCFITNISCSNNYWKFANIPNWFDINPNNGSCSCDVVLKPLEKNPSSDEVRTAVLELESAETEWNHSTSISVSQKKSNCFIKILPDNNFSFNYEAHTIRLKVISNGAWHVDTSQTSWINYEITNDSILSMNINENFSNLSRECTVLVISEKNDLTVPLTISQSISSIETQKDTLFISNTGGDYSFPYKSETNFNVETDSPWIIVPSDTIKKESTSFSYSISPNTSSTTRNGYIYIKTGGTRRVEVPVKQIGTYLATDSDSYLINSLGGIISLQVLTNDKWHLEIPDSTNWIKSNDKQGLNSDEIKLYCSDNPSANSRKADILIESDLGLSHKFCITQKGRFLNLSFYKLYSNKEGGNLSPIVVQTDGTVVLTNKENWIDAKYDSTTNIVQCKIQNNNDSYSRIGKIALSLQDLKDNSKVEKNIKIYQTGTDVYSFFINDFEGDENWDDVENGEPYQSDEENNKNDDTEFDGTPIDLGLSVLWSNKYLYANTVSPAGNFYAWGEIESKEYFSSDNYGYEGVDIGKNISGTKYDVAYIKTNGKWQMPSKDEVKELIDNCSWILMTNPYNNKGYLVTGPSGKCIFLPLSGECYSNFGSYNSRGGFWTSSYNGDVMGNLYYADRLLLDSNNHRLAATNTYVGLSILPIKKK